MANVARIISSYHQISGVQKWSKSKRAYLDRAVKHLGRCPAETLSETFLVDWALGYPGSTITAHHTLSHLSAAITYCHRRRLHYIPHPLAAREACVTLRQIGAVRMPHHDPGRISDQVINQVLAHWHSAIPPEMIFVLVDTTLRSGELCRLDWSDVDLDRKTILVRNRKNPRAKWGNHQQVPLLGRSWSLLCHQRHKTGRVCPHAQPSLYRAWKTAVIRSGYVLTLHDLRHEGLSRLGDRGWSIPQLMAVSGHKSPATLNRYVHISPESLLELDAATRPEKPTASNSPFTPEIRRPI